MMKRSGVAVLAAFLVGFLLLFLRVGLTAGQNTSPWLTLSGRAPAIIAKGGLSGLFPDSSLIAYNFVSLISSNDTTLWCNVQLTKDGIGVCLPDINLDNCTNIGFVYPQSQTTYMVNGVNTSGWFSVDFTSNDLSQVFLTQAIYSRTPKFGAFPILPVDVLGTQINHSALWLNIQHNAFYTQHNLSMRSFLLSAVRQIIVDYVSSPEVVFLSGIAPRLRNTRTKLIFRFLDKSISEPSTNRTYGSLLSNLTFIKTFASGILVPKNYIWPVSSDNYLLPYTSIVNDAHKAGLEIYAADFANDNILSFNYSYDPVAEYLMFINNGVFSVDGVLTDFPITPSEAIGCFSQLNKSNIDHGKPLIISNKGASGDYPDCTDLAYQKAVEDGADVIDCPVQVTKDGHLICMSAIDLTDTTTVTRSQFSSQFSSIPQLQSTPGIFTFNLSWDQIQKNLKPLISQPFASFTMVRNPLYKNSGAFMTLSDFLTFAKNKPLSGVLISVEHAAFMAQQLGFSVVDSVISTLNDAGYNKTTLEVMIQSSDSAVLVKFKQLTKYKLVYQIDKSIGDAISSSVADIKRFANAVALQKQSIYPSSLLFTTRETGLVSQFHEAGLDVYAYVFCNEFVSQPWDFLSDATVEINSYVNGIGVDGVITDFPGTARRYKRSSCRNMGSNTPNFMQPIQAGQLLQLMLPSDMPPALSPMLSLTIADVVEPPLPPASVPVAPGAAPPSPRPSSGHHNVAPLFFTLLMICVYLLI
ncbi:glycerophosphodiester phosphodiesterase GDPDL4-like [Curcuma longa]|uniref:glycerophosphodiester phosphodiesterase GDPDL4-like n=1 Tax=Curcuma longa TaxID=136217 RepID=UPI003D9E3E66